MYYLSKRDYDYAIRICAYLAGSGPNAHFPIKVLASKLLISKPFATKIVYQLKKNKILFTTRGKNGGASLATLPKNISFFNIIEAMGLAETVSSCISTDGFCPLPAPCKIHSFFIAHENEIIEKLKNTYISDFAFSDEDINNSNN